MYPPTWVKGGIFIDHECSGISIIQAGVFLPVYEIRENSSEQVIVFRRKVEEFIKEQYKHVEWNGINDQDSIE